MECSRAVVWTVWASWVYATIDHQASRRCWNLQFCRMVYVIFQQVSGYWNGLIGELMYGNSDLIVAPLTITEERLKYIDLTSSFMEVRNVIEPAWQCQIKVAWALANIERGLHFSSLADLHICPPSPSRSNYVLPPLQGCWPVCQNTVPL